LPPADNLLRLFSGAIVSGFLDIATLNALDPDAFTVRNNVTRLETGKEFEAPCLATLSVDAVPPLLDSLSAMSQADRSAIQDRTGVHWSSSDVGWRTCTISRYLGRIPVGSGS
jgi:hypothetical protein